jgi:hypothetical protein
MKIKMSLSGIPGLARQLWKAFHCKIAINGIPLKLACSSKSSGKRGMTGSIEVGSAPRSAAQRMTKSCLRFVGEEYQQKRVEDHQQRPDQND